MRYAAALLLATTIATSACSKKDGAKNSSVTMAQFSMSGLSADGCLNVQKLTEVLNNPQFRPVTQITTVDFDIKSSQSIRSNFAVVLAAGVFQHERGINTGFYEFQGLTQTKCESLTSEGESAETSPYKILDFAENRISIRDDKDIEYDFEFIPPASLRITYQYVTHDYNCSRKEAKIHVNYTQVVHYQANGASLPQTEAISNNMVSYLTRLPAESSTLEKLRAELSSGSDGITLNHDELSELRSIPVPAEFLTCSGGSLPPEDIPEPEDPEDEEPEVPAHDDENDGDASRVSLGGQHESTQV